ILKRVKSNSYHDTEYKRIINVLNPFTYLDAHTDVDGVFGLEWWGENGATGVIYPQLQRWMNNDALNEDLGREIHEAMILPFDRDERKRLSKEFRFNRFKGQVHAGGGGFSV